jgi:hypothetical protein
MNWKGFGRKQSWSNFKDYLSIRLEELRRTKINLRISGLRAEIIPGASRIRSRSGKLLDHVVRSPLIECTRFEVPVLCKTDFKCTEILCWSCWLEVDPSKLVFWDVTPCRLGGKYQRFGETYCLHLQPWCFQLKGPHRYLHCREYLRSHVKMYLLGEYWIVCWIAFTLLYLYCTVVMWFSYKLTT